VSLTTDVPVGSNEECKHLVHDHKIDDFLKREKEIDEVKPFSSSKATYLGHYYVYLRNNKGLIYKTVSCDKAPVLCVT